MQPVNISHASASSLGRVWFLSIALLRTLSINHPDAGPWGNLLTLGLRQSLFSYLDYGSDTLSLRLERLLSRSALLRISSLAV